jgi:60 kDa SS-A/Ro ribonucleoprotein
VRHSGWHAGCFTSEREDDMDTLFRTPRSTPNRPLATAINAEGAPAYALSPRAALAQYVATGCLSETFYATAELQLDALLTLADACPARYVAQAALWGRLYGRMKDAPAVLVAYLSVVAPELAEQIFDRVIDDGKMLRNFVQVVRSGQLARRSLASMPKRLVRRWLARRSDEQLFRASVGQQPSLADVIKLAHPKPDSAARSALYAYLCGRAYDAAALPSVVQAFEAWKARPVGAPPAVPFQLLTALELGRESWIAVAKHASWTETRMNLNTFARHGVFTSKGATAAVAAKLRDAEAIARAKPMPYQLMTTWKALGPDVPREVVDALEDALELALTNVPRVDGKLYVCPDVSGSMQSPVTGQRGSATTQTRCIDVAALIASAMLRVNDAEVLPFDQDVVDVRIRASDRVTTNARKLAAIGGGGTACAAPVARLNARGAMGRVVVLVSDNESWIDARAQETALVREWRVFRARNPGARLVCIDLAPNRTTQAPDAELGVFNVGGFSDVVFDLVGDLANARRPADWATYVEAMPLDVS